MSFQVQERGDGAEVQAVVAGGDATNARENAAAQIVRQALEDLAKSLGGYVVVHATGTVKATPDPAFGGDSIVLQVNTIVPPKAPVPDAGLAAAGGSPLNFPPEASTAAPATEDNSPPATQEPIPQPEPIAEVAPEPTPEPAPEPAAPVVKEAVQEPQPEVAPVESEPVAPVEEDAPVAQEPVPPVAAPESAPAPADPVLVEPAPLADPQQPAA